MMDLAQRDKLSALVEELTTSGEPQLNQDKMKEVKKICKVSNDYIEHFYHLVMSQLSQDHCEIRLSAFQMASELFTRSHHFRTLLVDNFQEFLELTVETDSEQPLPLPTEVAKKLKTLAIQTVQSWQASYGSAYKKLALGYHFLKQVKKVDFNDVQARTQAERRREEERQRRMERIYKDRVEKATRELEESYQEIEATLTEMDSCMKLLLPDDFDLSDPQTTNGSPQNSQPANQQSRPAQATAAPANNNTKNSNPANECALKEEFPCCSKDLKEERREGEERREREERREGEERIQREERREGEGDERREGEERRERERLKERRTSTDKKEGEACERESKNHEGEKEKKAGEEEKKEKKAGEEEKKEKKAGEEEKKEKKAGEEEKKEGEQEEEGSSEGEREIEEGLDEDVFIRNSGLMSHSYRLDINLDPGVHVKETEDNEAVVAMVIDLHKLITTKHLPAVLGWTQVFSKAGVEQQLLRRVLDLKKSLEAALQKHNELHIDYKTRKRRVIKANADGEGEDEEDDDDDEDFEEVPEKEGFEPHIPDHLREEYGLDPSPSTSTSSAPANKKPTAKRPAPPTPPISSSSLPRRLRRALEEEQDPTCAAATLRLLKHRLPQDTTASTSSSQPAEPTAGPSGSGPSGSGPSGSGPSSSGLSGSGSDQKVSEAPVVPFGLDLFYWGQEQPSAGKIIKSASQHQFWVPCEMEGEEVENEELSAAGRSRYISFPGTFTPVGHYCHAPLGNGTLCQRQDRVKCPFHGVIVPRDAEGRPTRQEDREREERRRREEQPDWRDPELMREIEAATGEDLGSDRLFGRGKGRGKGKGKKKKYPNLSDLKQNANTSRSRLEKKVFNKSSMRRVTEMMNKVDKRKHEKFSNQFNYALN